jgi:hypothetical protein
MLIDGNFVIIFFSTFQTFVFFVGCWIGSSLARKEDKKITYTRNKNWLIQLIDGIDLAITIKKLVDSCNKFFRFFGWREKNWRG